MSLINLTASQLHRAAAIKEKIEALQNELNHLQGVRYAVVAPPASAVRVKRKISAAGIARIRAAQKARWAKVRASKQGSKA